MEKVFENSVDFADAIVRDYAKEIIDSSYEKLDISIKLHAMPIQSTVSHIKTKLD